MLLSSWLADPWDSPHPGSGKIHQCTKFSSNNKYLLARIVSSRPLGFHQHSATQQPFQFFLSENTILLNSDFNITQTKQTFFVYSSSTLHLTPNALQSPVINKVWFLQFQTPVPDLTVTQKFKQFSTVVSLHSTHHQLAPDFY